MQDIIVIEGNAVAYLSIIFLSSSSFRDVTRSTLPPTIFPSNAAMSTTLGPGADAAPAHD